MDRRTAMLTGAAAAIAAPALARTEDPVFAAHREWKALHTRLNAELANDPTDERNEEIERIYGTPEFAALKRLGETVPTTLEGVLIQAEWLRGEVDFDMYANGADASMIDSIITALKSMKNTPTTV